MGARPVLLAGHLDKEQPRVDHSADEARHGGRDQPVQATTGLDQIGESGNADEHGCDRVGREPFDVAGHAPVGSVTSSPVQDEQDCARDYGYRSRATLRPCTPPDDLPDPRLDRQADLINDLPAGVGGAPSFAGTGE
jgi:hypothetical protein